MEKSLVREYDPLAAIEGDLSTSERLRDPPEDGKVIEFLKILDSYRMKYEEEGNY